ncbi:hypothetical protein HDE_05949 [Halotydeus destructor]|nr:hypothetical protein HDE_05949 [Halotydeus destructor]
MATSGYVILTNGAPASNNTMAEPCVAEETEAGLEVLACAKKTLNPKFIEILDDCMASVNVTFPRTAALVSLYSCKFENDKEFQQLIEKASNCTELACEENGVDAVAEINKCELVNGLQLNFVEKRLFCRQRSSETDNMSNGSVLLLLLVAISGYVMLANGAPASAESQMEKRCSSEPTKEEVESYKCFMEATDPKVLQIERDCHATVNLTIPTTAQMYNVQFCKFLKDKEFAKLVEKANDCSRLKYEESKIDMQAEMEKTKMSQFKRQSEMAPERSPLAVALLVAISGYALFTSGQETVDFNNAAMMDKYCATNATKEEVDDFDCVLNATNPKLLLAETECYAMYNISVPGSANSVKVHTCKAYKEPGYKKLVREANVCSLKKVKEEKIDLKINAEKVIKRCGPKRAS